MTTSKRDALRAAFARPAPGSSPKNFNSQFYPFWDMEVGQSVTIRILPDLDRNNPKQFILEKNQHKLTINGKETKVSCARMYGEKCPVCAVSSDYYKAGDNVMGRRYYKTRNYLVQAIIIKDPLPADPETGETSKGKVKILSLGSQIFQIIADAISSDELEFDPHDINNGYDFIIKKTKSGQHNSYVVGTRFDTTPRALTEDEITAMEEHSVELHTLLPKQTPPEQLQAMLSADLNGVDYDSEGGNKDEESSAPAADSTPRPSPPAKTTKAQPPAETPADDDEEDIDAILARIRTQRASK